MKCRRGRASPAPPPLPSVAPLIPSSRTKIKVSMFQLYYHYYYCLWEEAQLCTMRPQQHQFTSFKFRWRHKFWGKPGIYIMAISTPGWGGEILVQSENWEEKGREKGGKEEKNSQKQGRILDGGGRFFIAGQNIYPWWLRHVYARKKRLHGHRHINAFSAWKRILKKNTQI